jgi:hypothetical protein
VVFLIGARFSLRHPIRTFLDLGGRRQGMQAMLDHLVAHPEKRFPARTRSRAVLDSLIGTILPAAPSPVAGMLL